MSSDLIYQATESLFFLRITKLKDGFGLVGVEQAWTVTGFSLPPTRWIYRHNSQHSSGIFHFEQEEFGIEEKDSNHRGSISRKSQSNDTFYL